MREKSFTKEHLDKLLELRINALRKRDWLKIYQERWPPKADGSRDLRTIRGQYTEYFLEILPIRYSRGDTLADIKTEIVDIAIERYVYLCGEIDKYQSWPVFPLSDRPDDYKPYTDGVQPKYHSVYCWLAWMLCFNADEKLVGKIAPFLCEAGKDRLIDTVLQQYQPNRDVATTCMNPETFGVLDQVIDASEAQRPLLIKSYLDDWPKYIGMLNGLSSIAIARTRGVRTREDLINSRYEDSKGFWAWEAALVVKFFGIDDSLFKDHEFYPYDLVHFSN